MTLIERLLADELPGERQYEREARIVLWPLLKEAAERIRALESQVRVEGHIDVADYGPDYDFG